ncbi:hypothetical protein ACOMHN_037702 [Nucella lapillus]
MLMMRARVQGHRWVDHPVAAVMEARVPGQWVDRPAAMVMEAREQGRCWIDHPAAAVMEARVQGRHWVDRPSDAKFHDMFIHIILEPRGSLTAADTDLSWEDGDTLSDLGSVSQSARKPWGRVALRTSSTRSEDSSLDDDDSEVDDDNSPEEDVIPTLQWESDSKYISMSRFVHDVWQEDRLDPPCYLTPAHGAVTGRGPVYMNMLDIFGERYDKGGDGT